MAIGAIMNNFDYIAIGFSLVLTILNIVNMVWVIKSRAQEPHKELEKRVANLEKEVSKLDERIYDEDVKIKDVEEATRLLLESTRALLSNLIYNKPEDVEEAYKKLNAFLINR